MPRLIVMLGREPLETYNLPQDRIRIGRSSQADVILDNVMISREHAEIRKVGTSFLIANLAGKNGVFVNGRWVDTLMLEHGDTIEIGKYTIQFEFPDDERQKLEGLARKRQGAGYRVTTTEMLAAIADDEGKASAKPRRKFAALDSNIETMLLAPDELHKVRESMAAVRKAHLIQRVGTNQQIHQLDGDRVAIGKGTDCDIRIDAGWLAPKVSASLQRAGGGWVLEALGGTVKVNGERIRKTQPLADDDALDIEGIEFRFHDAVTG